VKRTWRTTTEKQIKRWTGEFDNRDSDWVKESLKSANYAEPVMFQKRRRRIEKILRNGE
jgi:hypothetical protein